MVNDILAGVPGIFLSFMIGPVFFILLETEYIKRIRAAIVLIWVLFWEILYFRLHILGVIG
jgi:hypothetical protein